MPSTRPPFNLSPDAPVLHSGFYDLLALVPTPAPSRLFAWGAPPRRPARISKDMVSSPTGFVCVPCDPPRALLTPPSHLVHASDADQAEALLTRWGPDGLGKLGGLLPLSSRLPFFTCQFQIRGGPRQSRPV